MSYEDIKKEMLTEFHEIVNKIRRDFQKVEEELNKQNIQYINTIRNDFFGMKLVKDSFYIGAKPDVLNHRIILNVDGKEEYLYPTGDLISRDRMLRKRILEHIISKEIPKIEW